MNWSAIDGHCSCRLMRDSTAISIGDAAQGNQVRSTSSARPDSSVYDLDTANMAGQFLDSPSTTSEIDYQVKFKTAYFAAIVFELGASIFIETYGDPLAH